MHFQYGIYDSPVPAAFIRAVAPLPTPPPSSQRRRVFQAAERLVLVITSEIGTGVTGVVHSGTLEVELPIRLTRCCCEACILRPPKGTACS